MAPSAPNHSSGSTPARSAVLVLHGPNLNLLGNREPGVYGSTTLAGIDERLRSIAAAAGIELESFQTNHEGLLIDRIHAARDSAVGFVIINPAAFTHTSVAVRDALAAVALPFVEVHLSNVHRREAFRHHSYFSDLAEAVIAGMGPYGYEAALGFALSRLGRVVPGAASAGT